MVSLGCVDRYVDRYVYIYIYIYISTCSLAAVRVRSFVRSFVATASEEVGCWLANLESTVRTKQQALVVVVQRRGEGIRIESYRIVSYLLRCFGLCSCCDVDGCLLVCGTFPFTCTVGVRVPTYVL